MKYCQIKSTLDLSSVAQVVTTLKEANDDLRLRSGDAEDVPESMARSHEESERITEWTQKYNPISKQQFSHAKADDSAQ